MKAPEREKLEEAIFLAVLSCPHEISGERIVLQFSEGMDGWNALYQLRSRIHAAIELHAT